MNPLSARTSDSAYGVVIESAALLTIERLCVGAGSLETGGVLVGRYSEDRSTAIVLEATAAPQDSRRGPSWFQRGVTGLREMLRRRWLSKERTHYLGEWHFHPAPIVVPSTDDFEQMVQIAHAEEYKCREPLLAIFGAKHGKSGARLLRVFVCPADASPSELIQQRTLSA